MVTTASGLIIERGTPSRIDALDVLRGFAILGILFMNIVPMGLAFTTYLGQTLILQWLLFPGFGLALWGQFGLAELGALALAICVVQVMFAVIWLRIYRMGPFEWAWRLLTYLERQLMRRVDVKGVRALARQQ